MACRKPMQTQKNKNGSLQTDAFQRGQKADGVNLQTNITTEFKIYAKSLAVRMETGFIQGYFLSTLLIILKRK